MGYQVVGAIRRTLPSPLLQRRPSPPPPLAFALCSLAAPPALAQEPTSSISTPEVVESDEEFATLDLGERLVRGLGRPWSEVGAALVAPDSGTVEGQDGRVSWRVTGFTADRFDAVIAGGRVERIVLDFSPEGPDFTGYAAADLDAPFDVAVDPARRRLSSGPSPDGPWATAPSSQCGSAPPAARPDPVARDTSGVFEAVGVEEPPEIVGGLGALMRRVAYPEDARTESVAGTVFVQFVINTNGLPSEIVALRSPDPRLSAAAVAAVGRTRFWPGHIGGEPVRTRCAVPVRFVPEAVTPPPDG